MITINPSLTNFKYSIGLTNPVRSNKMSPYSDKEKQNEYQRNLMRKRRNTPLKVCPNCLTSYQGHSCPICKNGKGTVVNYGN